jgi:hypothetical protein
LDTGQEGGGVLASVGVYPTFVLVGFVLCSAAALFGRAAPAAAPRLQPSRFRGSVSWIALALVTNLMLAERAGFILASASMFWLTARAFDNRHPFRDAAFAAMLSLCAYALFGRLLQLPLPAGVVERWI